LEAVFFVPSVPRLYKEDQLTLRDSLEMAVRRVGAWCEWAPACEDVSSGVEERPLLEDFAKQRSEYLV
jgi:hypothetical protein